MMIMEIHAGRLPFAVKQIKADATNSLSASGSINFPKLVTRLYFLAIFPSKRSVRLATIKIATAAYMPALPRFGISMQTTKGTIRITRSIVSLFGKFMASSLLSNHIHMLR